MKTDLKKKENKNDHNAVAENGGRPIDGICNGNQSIFFSLSFDQKCH